MILPSPIRFMKPPLPIRRQAAGNHSLFRLAVLIPCFVLFSGFVYPRGSVQDKTLSPYFFVMSEDPSIDQLHLKYTSSDVKISGVIADVTVMQRYCNEGDNVLEAIYVFPASTRAAVLPHANDRGDRLLTAQIKEKEKARQEYEEAREEGRTVTLLEQERPNIFKMNVANILPGDTIEVEMKYTELLIPTDAEYEFVYPTVVGPRYASPSHSVTLEFMQISENTAVCGNYLTGNKDVVVKYRP